MASGLHSGADDQVLLAALVLNSPPPRFAKYLETLLDFPDVGERSLIDLRRELAEDDRRILRHARMERPFALVTAHNPYGMDADAVSNADAERRLRRTVEKRGIPWLRADGLDPQQVHRESGLGLVMPLAPARDLAREFGQDAIFWFDGRTFWLVGVRDDFASRLPRNSIAPVRSARRAEQGSSADGRCGRDTGR